MAPVSTTLFAIGLGNPGAEYEDTPHNLGFRVVDTLAAKWRTRFRAGPGSFWWTPVTPRRNTVLVKPTTYMNRSGEAVLAVVERSKIPLENLLVVCDDLQLPFGKVRLRRQGGAGGHKGLESIIYHLGSEDFARLRIGVGGGDIPEQWVEQVLSPFSDDQEPEVARIVKTASQAVECWIRDGIEAAMNRFNASDIVN
jgi:PTH1 family peptidyl-tRNA hydrolase